MVKTIMLEDSTERSKDQSRAVMKTLENVAETTSVDIEFQDLSYSVKNGFNAGTKDILRSITGKFYSGELTAIMGPSGSGKTTLLNILAGYVLNGVTGDIKINKIRKKETIHKLSAYIMQEVMVQPLLTVKEAMIISARLKIDNRISFKEKLVIVDEILSVLGLTNVCDTMSEQLSGGERKRLCIALELVNNPPVIFLDEPTSGLDTVATTQCLETLKVLTGQGRTVICSIHQPTASNFLQFDQVYFMANGMCVYNGSPSKAISYLSFSGLPCPTTYSPAEYIIEIVQTNAEYIPTFVQHSQNGKSDNWQNKPPTPTNEYKDEPVIEVYQETTETLSDIDFVTSFWTQFVVLFQRMMLQQRRNKVNLVILITHHIFCGLVYGSLFYKIGHNASLTQQNFSFGTAVMVFFVFTYVMTPALLFPAEVKLLKREYNNRWYGLKAYYLALMVRSIPSMVLFGAIFLITVYLMTDQPLEAWRFLLFLTTGLLVATISEAIGITVGALFRVTNAAIIGPAFIAPMLLLSFYGMGYVYENIILPIKIAMSLSYMRYGGNAMVIALLEDRHNFECPKTFCFYKDPQLFLRHIGMNNTTASSRIFALLGFTVFFKVIGYLALRYRLNSEVSHTCKNYIYSLLGFKK